MNTNNVNKTCAVLQTAGGKDESNIFILCGNCNGHHLSSYSKIIVNINILTTLSAHLGTYVGGKTRVRTYVMLRRFKSSTRHII